MQLTSQASINAIAIAHGMRIDRNIFDWCADRGFGGVELYGEIAALAELSYDLMSRVGACPDFEHESFPGVYVYEVDEEFGTWLATQMREGLLTHDGGWIADNPRVKRELGRLAYAFFAKVGGTITSTEALIWQLTDYDRHAVPVSVEVLPIIVVHDEVTAQYTGPNDSTTGWAVYERMEDGTARWYADRDTETEAAAVGRERAKDLGVPVAPQAWVKK